MVDVNTRWFVPTREHTAIDPRSFHVFEVEGELLLFDRATGTTCEVSELAYHTLRTVREGATVADALAVIADQDPEIDVDAIRDALAGVKQRGFFRSTPAPEATDEEIDALWDHKPRRI